MEVWLIIVSCSSGRMMWPRVGEVWGKLEAGARCGGVSGREPGERELVGSDTRDFGDWGRNLVDVGEGWLSIMGDRRVGESWWGLGKGISYLWGGNLMDIGEVM